jgi:DNA-directed RNA polymerase specialized sigma24 family protein
MRSSNHVVGAAMALDAASPPGDPLRRVLGTEAPVTRRTFEAFYREEVDQLYRALSVTLGDHHVGREAVDEAMVRACVRWRTVGGYDRPEGWVYRVALNWARSRWRKVRRELPFDPPADDEPAALVVAGPEPSGGPALVALQQLPLEQRAVVVCRVLLDLDTAQTATALRIPEGTAKSRLARGLAVLRRTVEQTVQLEELEEDDR